MMRKLPLVLLTLLASLSLFVVACGSEQDLTAPPITANLLIEPSEGAETWFRDVSVPKGTDGYELLEAAVDGELESEWFAQYRSHFVSSILGVEAVGAQFWGVFVWDEGTESWGPLPVGADLYSVKEGHIMAWALVEYDPDSPQVPTSKP
jgi:hypothetical protein